MADPRRQRLWRRPAPGRPGTSPARARGRGAALQEPRGDPRQRAGAAAYGGGAARLRLERRCIQDGGLNGARDHPALRAGWAGPVHFGAFVALMRRASLTSSLIAPVMGSDRPALSAMSAPLAMSLSGQVKEIMSHSLSASEAPELISSAARSLARSMPVVSASRPASIRPTALIHSSRLFMVLPTWPCPTSPRWA